MGKNKFHCNNDDDRNCYENEDLNDYFDMSDDNFMFEVEDVRINDDNSNSSCSNNDSWDFSLREDNNCGRDSRNECYENIRDNECDKEDWDNDCNFDSDSDSDSDCDWNCDCDCDDHNYNKAELIVEKSVDKEIACQGEVLRYCLTIRNIGTAPACDVIVKDCLDKCLCYVSGSLRINNRKVNACRWTDILIKTIKPSECVSITFKVVVKECSSELVENFAVVCYSYVPYDCGDRVNEKAHSNTVTTRIMRVEAEMVKSVNKERVQLGEIVIYTIDITNRCHATIESFILRDQLSPALRCIEVLSRGQKYNCCRLSRGINLGQIAPHETVSVYIKARVEAMGEGCRIRNTAFGVSILNGIVSEEIRSNTVTIGVRFNQCREVELEDIVRLSCQMGPAIGIIDSTGKVEITKVDRIGGCGRNNRLRVSGVVKTEYIYDKGYDCHKKVCSEVPFNLIIRIPSGVNSIENLDLKVCLKNISSRINCGYTIESDLELEVCLRSK